MVVAVQRPPEEARLRLAVGADRHHCHQWTQELRLRHKARLGVTVRTAENQHRTHRKKPLHTIMSLG